MVTQFKVGDKVYGQALVLNGGILISIVEQPNETLAKEKKRLST